MSFIGAVPATLFESMLLDNGGWNGPLVLNARSESAAKLVIKFEFFDVIVGKIAMFCFVSDSVVFSS